VTPKIPLGRLVGTALHTAKHPVGTAGSVVGRAKEGVALGLTLAEQLTRSAVDALERATARESDRTTGARTPLRPVPDVNAAGHPVDVAEPAGPAEPAAPTEPPEPVTPTAVPKPAARKAPAKKAPAKKAPVKKAPVKKAPAKKAVAKKAPTAGRR
jgi:outer membrane biosynthesis protein TonB